MAKMAAIPDDCERTATVALPTAASPGFISGEVGISAALDAFSTVYGLPLLNAFWDGQTNKQTNRQTYGHERSLHLALRATPTRGNKLQSPKLKLTQSLLVATLTQNFMQFCLTVMENCHQNFPAHSSVCDDRYQGGGSELVMIVCAYEIACVCVPLQLHDCFLI